MNGPSAIDDFGADRLLRIDRDLDHAARQARVETNAGLFYQELLEVAARLLGAEAVLHWRRGQPAGVDRQVAAMTDDFSFDDLDQIEIALQDPLETVARLGRAQAFLLEAQSFSARRRGDLDEPGRPSAARVALLAPVALDDEALGVLLAIKDRLPTPPSAPSSSGDCGGCFPWEPDQRLAGRLSDQDSLQVLREAAEIAADFEANHQRRNLLEERRRRERLDALLGHLRGLKKPLDLAYILVNEGKRYLDCDRVSLLTCSTRSARVLAISSVDTIDRRSSVVRQLEQLAADAARLGEPVWSREEAEQPAELQRRLNAFIDAAHCREVGVLPLISSADRREERCEPSGVLVVEQFDQGEDRPENNCSTSNPGGNGVYCLDDPKRLAAMRRRLDMALPRLADAWGESLEVAAIPGMLAVRRLHVFLRHGLRRRWRRLCLLAVVSLAGAAALLWCPADFRIESTGQLQPAVRRQIFAPTDADVRELYVRHDQRVMPGQPLVQLHSTELEVEFQRIQGDLNAGLERLRAIDSTQTLRNSGTTDSQSLVQLSASRAELQELVAGYRQQLALLEQQRKQLRIVSPLRGRVITWDVERLLGARPVRRGQTLLTLAEDPGPWILELQVPDAEMGHVLDAQQQLRPDLPVTYIVKTDPATTRRGAIIEVARHTTKDPRAGSTVLVKARLDDSQWERFRSGATVVARIDCGRRSLGYVWFRQLLEFYQRQSWSW